MIDKTTCTNGHSNDIFVSYSEEDNCQKEASGGLWVDLFIDLLQKCLSRMPGIDDSCSVWTDHQLAKGGALTPELINRIEHTPIFVIVLSPDYLGSEWCASKNGLASEIPTFLKMADSRLVDGRNQVFVVEKTEAPPDRPPEFSAAPLFRFWVKDSDDSAPQTFDASLEDVHFVDNLNDLALDIAREHRRLRKNSAAEPTAVTAEQKKADGSTTAFLAITTGDLNPLRKKVKRYLEQAGIRVVPEAWHSNDPSEFHALLEKHLVDSDLFVQLLGFSAGKLMRESNESRASFQHRRSVEMGIPVFQWRSSELSAEDIEEDIEDPKHAKLLLGKDVQAVDIEDFNRDVVEHANHIRINSQIKSSEKENLDAYLFVDMQSPDRPGAAELCRYLEGRGIQYKTITTNRDQDKKSFRQKLADTLLETDGMIVVYDQKDNEWVEPRLNEVRKILQLPFARSKESNPKLVYISPPEGRPHHGIQLRNMAIVDCSHGFDPCKLEEFLDEVESYAQRRYRELEETQFVEKRDHYDVFLAHNSIDKPFVRELYTHLKERVIHPWLDESEITAGSLFQDEIQQAILKSDAAAILIGKHGLGAWQKHELKSLISLCIEKGLNVIPVLLPEVDAIPDDLLFLKQHHYVKFNDAGDRAALDQLATGIKY